MNRSFAKRGLFALGLLGALVVGGLERAVAGQTRTPGDTSAAAPVGEIAVTFAGFQRLPNNRYRVFVQLQAQPGLAVSKTDTEVVFTLQNSHIALPNNKNPLDATFIETPLSLARLVEGPEGVKLVLTFKRHVETEHRFVTRRGGRVTLDVEFSATEP